MVENHENCQLKLMFNGRNNFSWLSNIIFADSNMLHALWLRRNRNKENQPNKSLWTDFIRLPFFMASMFLYRTKLKMLFATESPFPISLNICCIVEDIHWKQTSADVNISFKTIALNKYLRAVSNMEIYIPNSAQWWIDDIENMETLFIA